MPRPTDTPIGLLLTRSARAVERAFDEALAAGGGSRPVWLVLMALKASPPRTQAELAAAVGIRAATLSHHLDAMESDGLVTRERLPDNRRVHVVRLTDAGDELFGRLAGVARTHDRRLRAGLDDTEIATLRVLLRHLAANVADPEPT